MKRWLLVALLVLGVVCTGIGVAVTGNPLEPATFGWTAYSPLSGESYVPVNLTWVRWAPRIGLALVALGAGTSGAVVAALVITRPRRTRA